MRHVVDVPAQGLTGDAPWGILAAITLHADEVAGRCLVDVFSCRPFDPAFAEAVAVEHFGGTATVKVLRR